MGSSAILSKERFITKETYTYICGDNTNFLRPPEDEWSFTPTSNTSFPLQLENPGVHSFMILNFWFCNSPFFIYR